MLKTTAIGYLGNDAQTRQHEDKVVLSFSIAHTERFKGKDGKTTEKTQWVNCAKWYKATDTIGIAPYLKKGTQVYIEGVPDCRTYTNKEGQTAVDFTVTVSTIELLGSAKKEEGTAVPVAAETVYSNEPPMVEAPF